MVTDAGDIPSEQCFVTAPLDSSCLTRLCTHRLAFDKKIYTFDDDAGEFTCVIRGKDMAMCTKANMARIMSIGGFSLNGWMPVLIDSKPVADLRAELVRLKAKSAREDSANFGQSCACV